MRTTTQIASVQNMLDEIQKRFQFQAPKVARLEDWGDTIVTLLVRDQRTKEEYDWRKDGGTKDRDFGPNEAAVDVEVEIKKYIYGDKSGPEPTITDDQVILGRVRVLDDVPLYDTVTGKDIGVLFHRGDLLTLSENEYKKVEAEVIAMKEEEE